MILYRGYIKKSRKYAVAIKQIQQRLGYRINTQKSVKFLYTRNEQCKEEIKIMSPFTKQYNASE